MDIIMIVLRLIHIGTAVFWGGTVFFLVSFLTPAVQAAGPEGGKVMQRLALSRFPRVLPVIASLTVLSGLTMYWIRYLSFDLWNTHAGLAFAFGGLMGLTALAIGLAVTVPALNHIAEFAKQVMASGKPPTPEQMKIVQGAQMRMMSATIQIAILLSLAVAAMASARYL
jgi:uncharacterized membrane protein